MKESDYYPAGAYSDPSAPYNEQIVPEMDFDVRVTQTLVKETTISTDQYQPEYDEEDGHTYANTDDTDWQDAYEKVALTPSQLIEVCGKLAQHLINGGIKKVDGIWLPAIVKECNDWDVDETTVEEL
jgi:hypothetical protein